MNTAKSIVTMTNIILILNRWYLYYGLHDTTSSTYPQISITGAKSWIAHDWRWARTDYGYWLVPRDGSEPGGEREELHRFLFSRGGSTETEGQCISASLLKGHWSAIANPTWTEACQLHAETDRKRVKRQWHTDLRLRKGSVLKELNQLATCQLYITQWWYGMSRTWTADRSALLPVLQQDILQVNAKLAELGKTAQQYTQNLFTPRQTFGVMIHAINYFIRMNGCQCC